MALTDPNLDAPTVPSPDLPRSLAETGAEVAAAVTPERSLQNGWQCCPAMRNTSETEWR